MGASSSQFTREELQEYSELTYFSKKEILLLFERFCEIDPEALSGDRYAAISIDKVSNIPELRVNPFKDRICKLFATPLDDSLIFEDFLDMMSAFSDMAPRSVKAEWAFKIYDFNEDDLLDFEDLEKVVNCLTGDSGSLKANEMEQLIQNIMKESDLDEDGKLSFAEFEHVIAKCPDFMNSFKIRF